MWNRLIVMYAISALALMISACTQQRACSITRVREIPLKTTELPAETTGMHRSQSTYLLYGAVNRQQRKDRLGQYYFITWYDAAPQQPLYFHMLYRQGKTGSTVHNKIITLPAGRPGGDTTTRIDFTGAEAKTKGELLAWKLQLKDKKGQVLSEYRSFLWNDAY